MIRLLEINSIKHLTFYMCDVINSSYPLIDNFLKTKNDRLLVIHTPGKNKILSRYDCLQHTLGDLLTTIRDKLKYKSNSSLNYLGIKYRGDKIQDEKRLLKDYNISEKEKIDLVELYQYDIPYTLEAQQLETDTTIHMKLLSGSTITINLAKENTIEYLKYLVSKKEGIPIQQQRIIYDGKQLEDNVNLGSYISSKEETFHLVLRLCGGMFHEYSGRDGDYKPLSSVLDSILDIEKDSDS